MTQTTAERIARLIDENYQIHGLRADYETAKIVARELDARQAQIDALTAQLAEARAELERLRPAAEAWEAGRAFSDLMGMDASDPTADGYRPVTDDEIIAASIACQKADAAARAAKESQP